MSTEELQKIISPKFTKQVALEIVTTKSGLSDVVIDKINIQGGSSNKGDSYLSQICRFMLTATGKNQRGNSETVTIPVIVKSMPTNIARRKTFRSAEFFENEIIFYEKVWRVFQKFQESKGIQNQFNIIPMYFSSWADGSDDYIALLNVSDQGYASAERGTGLDFNHTTAILRRLAEFHALSLAFKDQNPTEFEELATSLKETYFAEKYRPWYIKFHEKLVTVALDCVEKELPASYLDKFKHFVTQDLFGLICATCQRRGLFGVVTHSDVWAPNFLIKYQEDKRTIDNVMMIDFQIARYGTLANDVNFFLLICSDVNLLEERWDDLIFDYHQALSKNLVKFGSKADFIKLDALHKELKHTINAAVAVIIEGLVMSLLGEEDVADLDSIQGEEAVPIENIWLVQPFKEKEKREKFARAIKFVVDRNFI